MDCVRDTLGNGRVFGCFSLVDDCTRECPAIEVDFSLAWERVVRVLDRVAAMLGFPRAIGCDDGPEFVRAAVDGWAHRRFVALDFVDPGEAREERIHRELQWGLPERAPERDLVPEPRRCATDDRVLADRLMDASGPTVDSERSPRASSRASSPR